MGLNKSKGNMYEFVTHTWNTVKGACMHDCSYCYMKRWGKLKSPRFDEKELKTNLGEGNFIFVGSSNDLFAEDIPFEWIEKTIKHCIKYNKNRYLIQTKNPQKFLELEWLLKEQVWVEENGNGHFEKLFSLATTFETNRVYPDIMANSPNPLDRVKQFRLLGLANFDKYITIEPIMDFDLDIMIEEIRRAGVKQVNLGCDTGNHNLPEPSKQKLLELIDGLKTITTIHNKKNLKRLLK